MSMTGADLAQRKAEMTGSSPSSQREQTEKVVKMFSDGDKVAVIKADPQTVTVGSPPMDVVIRPMTPGQLVKAFPLLRKLLMPLVTLFKQRESNVPISFDQIFEAFGENIEHLPELLYIILSRGNEVTKEWVEDHLDLAPDLQVIMPIFIKQNALDKLFLGKRTASAQPSSNSDDAKQDDKPQASVERTEESQAPSTTAADGTE